MPLFRKRPVIVEAWQNYTGDAAIDGRAGLATREPTWLTDSMRAGVVVPGPDHSFLILTLEGQMRCGVGDWIIRGVKAELYPCKPDIFAATYEAV
jgi:hypothetical protein